MKHRASDKSWTSQKRGDICVVFIFTSYKNSGKRGETFILTLTERYFPQACQLVTLFYAHAHTNYDSFLSNTIIKLQAVPPGTYMPISAAQHYIFARVVKKQCCYSNFRLDVLSENTLNHHELQYIFRETHYSSV